MSRVVAVLGYSRRRDRELHRICAERLAHAQGLAAGARAVVLSGTPESELMRAAWTGPDVELICDPDSRSTAQNARNVAAAAGALGATHLVAVTSHWHRARARLLLAWALRGSDIKLSVEAPSGRRRPLLVARELACLALLPFQLTRSRRTVG
jgi:uncharacterized SAM-binding protein YcdF (DUF218 family)